MKHNMGSAERVARLLLGSALALISGFYLDAFGVLWGGVAAHGVIGSALFLAGVGAFVTGWAAYCPVNAFLESNSCQACKVGETHSHLPA